MKKSIKICGKTYECDDYHLIDNKLLYKKSVHFRDMFKLFRMLFPDHPNIDNIKIYIVADNRRFWSRIYFSCSHFECNDGKDLLHLATFMAHMSDMDMLGQSSIELLDADAEALIFSLPYPDQGFWTEIMQYALFGDKNEST